MKRSSHKTGTLGTAKDITLKPISKTVANSVIKNNHYSGTVVNNSQLHFGVFLNGVCEGALQFGPSLAKKKMVGLVEGTGWNGFLELNRMAFSERLPKNSESRAIAISMKLIKKHYPHIEWIISFADGAQCGDGTIYRASGFHLIGIKKNNSIYQSPDGKHTIMTTTFTKGKHILKGNGRASIKPFIDKGYKPVEGFQLKYIYFLNKEAKQRLTVPILPFSKIQDMDAGMYKGEKR